MPSLKKTIYIYVYRWAIDAEYMGVQHKAGDAQYVGQATGSIHQRDQAHLKAKNKSSFERMLVEVGRDKFSLHVVLRIEDGIPLGEEANRLENQTMDRLGTHRPGVPGYNQCHAGFGGYRTTQEFMATYRLAATTRADRYGSPTGHMNTPEARRRKSLALRGRRFSAERRERHRELRQTPEYREKMRLIFSAPDVVAKRSEFAHRPDILEKNRKFHTGRKASLETRLKQSIALRGRFVSPETRRRKSQTARARGIRPSPDAAKKGGQVAGTLNAHVRWHLKRGRRSLACPHCIEAKSNQGRSS